MESPANLAYGLDPPPYPRIVALRAVFRAVEAQRLPPFLGSAVHGALGRALYRTVCAFPRRAGCAGCPVYRHCVYPALFEPPALESGALLTLGVRDQVPRPLVIGPEPGWTRRSGNPFHLAPGAKVPIRVTLIGPASNDVEVVVVALRRLAEQGLGIAPYGEPPDGPGTRRPRPGLELTCVTTEDAESVIYDAVRNLVTAPPPSAPRPDRGDAEVAVDLVTPLRLKDEGRVASRITPRAFVRTLAQRANTLGVLYGRGPVVNLPAALAAAERLVVTTKASRIHVRRYSARQRRRMEWPGLMGRFNVSGDALREIWPLLAFGELVQLGKGAALGFGRYRLIAANGATHACNRPPPAEPGAPPAAAPASWAR